MEYPNIEPSGPWRVRWYERIRPGEDSSQRQTGGMTAVTGD